MRRPRPVARPGAPHGAIRLMVTQRGCPARMGTWRRDGVRRHTWWGDRTITLTAVPKKTEPPLANMPALNASQEVVSTIGWRVLRTW